MNKLRHGDFVIRDRGGKWRAVTINIIQSDAFQFLDFVK